MVLLDAGADTWHANAQGATALMCAATVGDAELASLLINRQPEGSVVDLEETMDSILAMVAATDARGWCPLMFAAQNGHAATAVLLIDHGADLEAADASGRTALICAAHFGHADTAAALLDAGADPAAADAAGQAAWAHAKAEGHAGVFGPALMDRLAEVPLVFAAKHGDAAGVVSERR